MCVYVMCMYVFMYVCILWTVSLFRRRQIILQYVGLFVTDQGVVEQISRERKTDGKV